MNQVELKMETMESNIDERLRFHQSQFSTLDHKLTLCQSINHNAMQTTTIGSALGQQ